MLLLGVTQPRRLLLEAVIHEHEDADDAAAAIVLGIIFCTFNVRWCACGCVLWRTAMIHYKIAFVEESPERF